MTKTPHPAVAARRRRIHKIRVRIATGAVGLFVAVFSVIYAEKPKTTTVASAATAKVASTASSSSATSSSSQTQTQTQTTPVTTTQS